MASPEHPFSAGNNLLGFDLEEYEQRQLSRSGAASLAGSFSVSGDRVQPESPFSLADTEIGNALEEYEHKILSGSLSYPANTPQSGFTYHQSVDYYDWPAKLKKGDAAYDRLAIAWITANRAAVTDFPGLNKVKYHSTDYKGYNYNGHSSTDPKPIWGVTGAQQIAVYEGLRQELFGEGGASSINTYDDQILTIGWGFSVRNEMGRGVIAKTMQASADFNTKLLGAGLLAESAQISYVDTVAGALLTGETALQKIRWDPKVLSQLIYAAEANMTDYVAAQVAIFKQYKMSAFPTEGFQWPVDSVRLAVHLSHWLPAGIKWTNLRSSGGNVATIVKHFCNNIFDFQESHNKTNYYLRISKLKNNALFVDDKDSRFHMGNDAMVKAGTAGTIPTVAVAAFTDTYKTAAQYAAYVFVQHKEKVYLLS